MARPEPHPLFLDVAAHAIVAAISITLGMTVTSLDIGSPFEEVILSCKNANVINVKVSWGPDSSHADPAVLTDPSTDALFPIGAGAYARIRVPGTTTHLKFRPNTPGTINVMALRL